MTEGQREVEKDRNRRHVGRRNIEFVVSIPSFVPTPYPRHHTPRRPQVKSSMRDSWVRPDLGQDYGHPYGSTLSNTRDDRSLSVSQTLLSTVTLSHKIMLEEST